LEDLHKDFLLLNTDTAQVNPYFKSIIGNAKIDFYLADTILQPNGEPGIIRINKNNNGSKLYNKSVIVDPARFLNVYIGNISGSFSPSATPWTLPTKDAVYLGFDWVGQWLRKGHQKY